MHTFGRRRFDTDDESRNSLILALITFGEGWHNNHHRYHASERQGFYWWEIDLSHYGLTVLSWFGLVRDLKRPPRWIYEEAEGKRDRKMTPGRRRNADRSVIPSVRAAAAEGDEVVAAENGAGNGSTNGASANGSSANEKTPKVNDPSLADADLAS